MLASSSKHYPNICLSNYSTGTSFTCSRLFVRLLCKGLGCFLLPAYFRLLAMGCWLLDAGQKGAPAKVVVLHAAATGGSKPMNLCYRSVCVCVHIHIYRFYIHVYTHNIYIYIYIYVHIHLSLSLSFSISLSIYIYIYIHVYMFVYIYIYIYTHMYTYIHIYIYRERERYTHTSSHARHSGQRCSATPLYSASLRATSVARYCTVQHRAPLCGLGSTVNPRTNIEGFRGFDSSIMLILRAGIHRPIGDFPETLSQAMQVGVMLVGGLGVFPFVRELP